MNRLERRQRAKISRHMIKERPNKLTKLTRDEWPFALPKLTEVWVSKAYLVQIFEESNFNHVALNRLSVCRTITQTNGRWTDKITWDELQAIKHDVGFGDWYGVEIYPRDSDIVNVANMRHLWIMPVPLTIGWQK